MTIDQAWLISFYKAHQFALIWLGGVCLVAFVRGFAQGFREGMAGDLWAIGRPKRPHASPNNGWVQEPLQDGAGRDWERSTGCTVERRLP